MVRSFQNLIDQYAKDGLVNPVATRSVLGTGYGPILPSTEFALDAISFFNHRVGPLTTEYEGSYIVEDDDPTLLDEYIAISIEDAISTWASAGRVVSGDWIEYAPVTLLDYFYQCLDLRAQDIVKKSKPLREAIYQALASYGYSRVQAAEVFDQVLSNVHAAKRDNFDITEAIRSIPKRVPNKVPR